MRTLRPDQARRIFLAAQGFGRPRPTGRVDVRHFRRVLDLNSVVQLDSVNVAARAHYMPFWSRLGAYDRDELDRWLWRSGENFEYYAHVASLVPMAVHPLMRHRMQRQPRLDREVGQLIKEHPTYLDDVMAQVRDQGPLTVADLADGGSSSGPWWGWSTGRLALYWLMVIGRVAVHHRDNQFAIHYDDHDRVVPHEVRKHPTPTQEDAERELLLLAARACGIGTDDDLADHFRILLTRARPLLRQFVDEGALEVVEVEGWDRPAYVHREATLPRRMQARALLSPFDPVVWYRPRAERMFDFHYRIEIYVPKPQRKHGYYVLPFLLDDGIAARVDIKADRQTGRLLVQGSFLEGDGDRDHVAAELAEELRTYGAWLDVPDVHVVTKGDLATELRRALA